MTQETLDGSPALVEQPFVTIKFQAGISPAVGVNGCIIEDVIDVLVTRLEGFQRGPFRCRENALAITKLEEAKLWLTERTRKRQAQGVEGTYTAHVG
jgi:hypothetical protein